MLKLSVDVSLFFAAGRLGADRARAWFQMNLDQLWIRPAVTFQEETSGGEQKMHFLGGENIYRQPQHQLRLTK